MQRLWIAIRVFFIVLFNAKIARQVDDLLAHRNEPEKATIRETPPKAKEAPVKPAAKAPVRSEAITLLAALQREARFVDFIQEPLTGYSDAQVGAAARDVHRDCRKVLERMFALQAASPAEEGAELEVAAGFDPGKYHLTGNVVGEPPFRGRLTHHGWEAAKCELPVWSGKEMSARIVAPIEVEIAGGPETGADSRM
ncbi:MAG: DUF2760 domain-containing protein [Thermoguttaceae bacterium]